MPPTVCVLQLGHILMRFHTIKACIGIVVFIFILPVACKITYVATTHDLLAIPTSNLLSWKKGIRRIFEQKMKVIELSLFEISKIKGKVTFLWFDPFSFE